MRLRINQDRREILFRCFAANYGGEIAYAVLGIRGLKAEIEFPSDWHENRRAWVRLGFGLGVIAFSFPWSKVVPDEHQCSGPVYGFTFFDDGLHLHWGKCKGKRDDPIKIIAMPWRWRHIDKKHKRLTEEESHPYRYILRDGKVQRVNATIYSETRTWWRPWIPFLRTRRSIWVDFDGEIGERADSWKGGVTGCGYDMLPCESPGQTLRRMERERKFT